MKTLTLHGFGPRCQESYTTRHDWDCAVQAGDGGVVFAEPSYRTAFFEAFPRNPNVFIRGEGATVELAEESARRQYERLVSCPGHQWEARGYQNGGGYCRNCGSFAASVIPGPPCAICAKPTWYTRDIAGAHYCTTCERHKPLELWTETDWEMAYLDNDLFDDRRSLRATLQTTPLSEEQLRAIFVNFD